LKYTLLHKIEIYIITNFKAILFSFLRQLYNIFQRRYGKHLQRMSDKYNGEGIIWLHVVFGSAVHTVGYHQKATRSSAIADKPHNAPYHLKTLW